MSQHNNFGKDKNGARAGGPQSLAIACLAVGIAGSLSVLGLSSAAGTGFLFARVLLAAALIPNIFLLAYTVCIPGERSLGLLASVYAIFYLIVPGMFQAATGQFPFFSRSYPGSVVDIASAQILLFSGVFVGTYFGMDYRKINMRKANRDAVVDFDVVKASALLAFCIAAAVGIFFHLGSAIFLTSLRDFSSLSPDLFSPGMLIESALGRVLAFEALALCLILLISRKRLDSKVPFFLLLAPTLVVFFMLNYPLNSTRYIFLGWFIALGFIFTPTSRPMIKATALAVIVVGMFSIFPLLSNMSRGSEDATLLSPITYLTTAGDLDGFQSVMNVYQMVEAKGVGYGVHLLSALLFFIPRMMWNTKAFPTGMEAASFNGYPYTNISSPLPSEFFADFGWLGIAVGAVTAAFVLRRIETWCQRGTETTFLRRLFTGTTAAFVIIVFRGPLLGIAGPVSTALVIAALTLVVLRREERRGSAKRTRDPTLAILAPLPWRK